MRATTDTLADARYRGTRPPETRVRQAHAVQKNGGSIWPALKEYIKQEFCLFRRWTGLGPRDNSGDHYACYHGFTSTPRVRMSAEIVSCGLGAEPGSRRLIKINSSVTRHGVVDVTNFGTLSRVTEALDKYTFSSR
jgi:hypothetical protein